MDKEKQEAIEALRQIVEWWDKWNNAEWPEQLEDPPIDDARKILSKYKMKTYVCEVIRKGEQVSIYYVKANNLKEARRHAKGSKEKKGVLKVRILK